MSISDGQFRNPFQITKATDFTDDEINNTWVDVETDAIRSLLRVDSTTARFLVGGKGGGRTHLMRYASSTLQLIRAEREGIEITRSLRAAGYVGIYFLCSGLNSNRFRGKGQDDEAWDAVFAYYFDLWISQRMLEVISEVLDFEEHDAAIGHAVVEAALRDSKVDLHGHPETTAGLQTELRGLQAEIDRAVNNAAVTKSLNIEIRCNPSALTFGLANAIDEYVPQFDGIKLVLLMDEFENLTERQQMYVNTLIREKPVSLNIVVGSRRYGIKTDHQTFAGGEANRRGSEFDEIVLEDFYRVEKGRYEEFCNRLVSRRLREANFPPTVELKDLFLNPVSEDNSWWSGQALGVVRGAVGMERPHLQKLYASLRKYNGCPGDDAEALVESLRFDEHPVVEKYAVLLVYRRWANAGFVDFGQATTISEDLRRMLQQDKAVRSVRSSFNHYRADLYAQLRQEAEMPQAYFGISSFILMSGFLPRNLLMILKQVSRWAAFLGENPVEGSPMSVAAQQRGVADASEWFVGNTRALGKAGQENEIVVGQIGSFLRQLRFSDKPNEVSVCTFAVNPRDLNEEATRILTSAKLHSVLIEHLEGHRTKNREAINRKFQLHPMICPRFGLPVTRRGTVTLNSDEAAVLLSSRSSDADLRRIARNRLSLMDAPFRPAGNIDRESQLF